MCKEITWNKQKKEKERAAPTLHTHTHNIFTTRIFFQENARGRTEVELLLIFFSGVTNPTTLRGNDKYWKFRRALVLLDYLDKKDVSTVISSFRLITIRCEEAFEKSNSSKIFRITI